MDAPLVRGFDQFESVSYEHTFDEGDEIIRWLMGSGNNFWSLIRDRHCPYLDEQAQAYILECCLDENAHDTAFAYASQTRVLTVRLSFDYES